MNIKGIVHPEIKIMSSFIYPLVIPNLYFLLWNITEDILRFLEVNGNQNKLPAFFKISSVVMQKKGRDKGSG